MEEIRPENYRSIAQFMEGMGTLDRQTAQTRALEAVKYIDEEALKEQIVILDDHMAKLCTLCAKIQQKPDAFAPLLRGLDDMEKELTNIKKTKELKPVTEKLNNVMDGLNVLTDAKERLQVDDIEIQTTITQAIQKFVEEATK